MIVYRSPFSKAEILRTLPQAAKCFPEREFLYREFSDGSSLKSVHKIIFDFISASYRELILRDEFSVLLSKKLFQK